MIASLLDHLWQSTVFVCCAGFLTLLFRNNGAHTRYWLWFAASVKFLLPFSLLLMLGRGLAQQAVTPVASIPIAYMAEQFAAPFSGVVPVLTPTTPWGPNHTSILAVVWILGVCVVLLIWLVRWLRMDAIVRAAKPITLGLPIRARSSRSLLEPGLVGIWRPVLLLPEGLTARLSTAEIHSVIAHELCHLRRRDNLTASIHMLVEALFWFYPLTWWLGARLIGERERACDESVLDSGNDAQVYAEGILKVCRFYVQSPLASAAGISRANLKHRIEDIMNPRKALPIDATRKLTLALASAATVAVPVLFGLLAVPVTRAQMPPATSTLSADEIAQRRYEQNRPRTAVPFDPKQFDKFVGYYQLHPSAFFHIFRNENHYFLQSTGQPQVEQFPESDTKFFSQLVAAQVSFDTDARGHVTQLVLHQNGLEIPAKRVDEATAKKSEAALQLRIKSNTPGPGTEAWIRRHIDSMEKGQPNYDEMAPVLAEVARQHSPLRLQLIKEMGAFRSLTLKGVGHDGSDVYDATFERGQLEYRIAPLNSVGKADDLVFRPIP